MIFAHRHSHEAVAVQHRSPGGPFTFQPAGTVVLFRCACGDVRAQELAGRWSLAQVRGEPEPAAAEQVASEVPAGVAVAGT